MSLGYDLGSSKLDVHPKGGTKMRDLSRTIRDRIRRIASPDSSGVHFHQGPQGQAAPCYDEHCANPRLSV
jgi:hypothetical protein